MLHRAGSEGARRLAVQGALASSVIDLFPYQTRDAIAGVRITTWAGGAPAEFEVSCAGGTTADALAAVWPTTLRAQMLRDYPDRAFLAPVFAAGLIRCTAVPLNSAAGQVAAQTAWFDEIAYACAGRDPVTTTSLEGDLNGAFTVIASVPREQVHQSYWRNSFAKEIQAALPGATVQWDLPTARVAVLRAGS